MGYPQLYHSGFGRWVDATGFVGKNAVPGVRDYRELFPDAPSDLQPVDHTGTDGSCRGYTENGIYYPPERVPIYAIEGGVIIEATKDAHAREGRYIWSETLGIAVSVHVDAIKKRKIVYATGHFSSRAVNVGDRVIRGKPYFTQGMTGVATWYHNHTKIFVDDVLIDSGPYVFGLDGSTNVRSLLEDFADPVEPEPEPKVAPLPATIRYRYTDSDGLRLRDAPGGNVIGELPPGSELGVDMIAFANGLYWAHVPEGWCSLGGPRIWVEQIVVPDLSGTVADLTSKLASSETKSQSLNSYLDEIERICGNR